MVALVSRHAPTVPEGKAAAPPVAISVTGHSLGSALACLYVLENAKTNKSPTPIVCTFASPRVGDRAFVTAFNGLRPDLIALRHLFRTRSSTTPPEPLASGTSIHFNSSTRLKVRAKPRGAGNAPTELSGSLVEPEPAACFGMRDRDRCRCKTAGVAWRRAGLVAEYGAGTEDDSAPDGGC